MSTLKNATNEELASSLDSINTQIDELKAAARVITKEVGNRSARAKLVASLESAGISDEAKAKILGEFDSAAA
jgi:SLT domain-containing protein